MENRNYRTQVQFICDCCGKEATKATLDVSIRASLDRIDSSKPYEVGNIQFISTPINYMKNSMSDEQTREYLRVISANIINS